MAVTKNKALWIAATDVVEIVERLGAGLTPELREEHKFAIEVARAIERGHLSGNGTPGVIRTLGAAYTELSVAYWEHCEELRKANEALKARQAADNAAAEAAANDPLKKLIDETPQSLDEVLADRPPLYRKGDKVTVQYEGWVGGPEDGVVSSADWREGDLNTWVYSVVTPQGSYVIREGNTSWDIDFTK